MSTLLVDGLTFAFPDGWLVHKYDEWSFYRNQFGRMREGIKAVDLIASEKSGGSATTWFIEVKDYRASERTKPSNLGTEVAQKVFDTLAALLPAQTNANDAGEQQMASAALRAKKLRVVLHLEQPLKTSKLFPRAIDPADVAQRLKRMLKPVDPHPVVVEKVRMCSLQWRVS